MKYVKMKDKTSESFAHGISGSLVLPVFARRFCADQKGREKAECGFDKEKEMRIRQRKCGFDNEKKLTVSISMLFCMSDIAQSNTRLESWE